MYTVDVQDMLLHNFAGTLSSQKRHKLVIIFLFLLLLFFFPLAITRLDQVSPCRVPGSYFGRVIIGSHEPWPFALSPNYHFPVSEPAQKVVLAGMSWLGLPQNISMPMFPFGVIMRYWDSLDFGKEKKKKEREVT